VREIDRCDCGEVLGVSEPAAEGEKSLYLPVPLARYSETRQRLAVEVARTLAEFEQRRTTTTSDWWNRGWRLAQEAKNALGHRHWDATWALVLESRRCLIPLLTDGQKKALAASLRREATKLWGWRREAIDQLLSEEHNDMPDDMQLMEAVFHIDSAHANLFRGLDLRRNELTWLMVVLISSLIGILAVLFSDPGVVDFGAVSFNNARLVALAILFGIEGATLSAVQRTSRRTAPARVPDQRAAAVASIIRSLSGAATGLVALAAAQAGLVGNEAGAVLLAAFASGFSERYILRFITDGGGGTDEDSARADTRSDSSLRDQAERSHGMSEPAPEPAVYFRAGVGAAVLNEADELLALERRDVPGSWQLPQGGLEDAETPREALYRELREETGLTEDQVALIEELPDWLAYELPEEARSPKIGRGQTQKWFVLRLKDPRAEIRVSSSEAPAEFSGWKWIAPSDLLDEIVPFRQPVYTKLAEAIERIAGGTGRTYREGPGDESSAQVPPDPASG
jgi:putative (di)nucleoside polyphosphate hydrolase